MSDNNFPCPTCKRGGDCYDVDSCPNCQGTSGLQLAVECGTCEGKGYTIPDCYCGAKGHWCIPPKHRPHKPCPDCTNGYRPLTSDEVLELVRLTVETPHPELLDKPDAMACAVDFVVSLIGKGNEYTFKGSQVVLIPKEGI